MKKLFVMISLVMLLNTNLAMADEYKLINSDGSIENVIECTLEVCGNPNSLYSVLTLKPGQKYERSATTNIQPTKETNPYDIVTKTIDNVAVITHIEPVQVTADTRVLKKTEKSFDFVTNVMSTPDVEKVQSATVEIKVEKEIIDKDLMEFLLWFETQINAITNLFNAWVWVNG